MAYLTMKRFVAFIIAGAILMVMAPSGAAAQAAAAQGAVAQASAVQDAAAQNAAALQGAAAQAIIAQNTAVQKAAAEHAGKYNKIEIAFLIDASSSMEGRIEKVKENIIAFTKNLESQHTDMNARYAVIEYGSDNNRGHGFVYKLNDNEIWHQNSEQLAQTLSLIKVCRITERLTDAIGLMLTNKTTNNEPEMYWSDDSIRFAFVFSDEYNKNENDTPSRNSYGYANLAATIPHLIEFRLPVTVVTLDLHYSEYMDLVVQTGGIMLSIKSQEYWKSLSDYVDNVLAILRADAPVFKKAIYILPGYLGSELYDSTKSGAKMLWPSLPIIGQKSNSALINKNTDGSGEVAYAFGSDVLANGKDKYGTVNTYTNLVDKLKKEFGSNYDVKFFPYNWLGDLNESVKKLEKDAAGYEKVTLVTHSTGGLLAAAYIGKSVENQCKIEKAVLIAPPLYGTYAALLPLERGDSKKGGFDILDMFTNNKWVREITHNSPTTYQILPSREYFESTRAFDIKTQNGSKEKPEEWSRNVGWGVFYNTLNYSENINSNLLSSNDNPRSHKSFRKLFESDANISITDILRRVDTTIIGTLHGKLTPKKAKYDATVGGMSKFLDIKYCNSGDGTVFSTSMGVKLNKSREYEESLLDIIHFTDLASDKKSGAVRYTKNPPNHTDLVKDTNALNLVVDLINDASGRGAARVASYKFIKSEGGADAGVGTSADAVSTAAAAGTVAAADAGDNAAAVDMVAAAVPSGTGSAAVTAVAAASVVGITAASAASADDDFSSMASYVKLRVESDVDILIEIFDKNNKLVAHCDSMSEDGFDNDKFLCDRFGDDGETLTSIYMPKKGYLVRFTHGDKANTLVDMVAYVYMLDEEGDYSGFGGYYLEKTAAGGEMFELDMTGGVTFGNLGNLASEDKYPGLKCFFESYDEWELDFSGVNYQDGVVVLDNIGDTGIIGVEGISPDSLIWASSDESVIKVKNGVLTAVGYGMATITVDASDGSGSGMQVRVKVTLSAKSVNFKDLDIIVDEAIIIRPMFDSDCVTENKVVYTYDNGAGIITIKDDVLRGIKPGVVEVTGTAAGGVAGTFNVRVHENSITKSEYLATNEQSSALVPETTNKHDEMPEGAQQSAQQPARKTSQPGTREYVDVAPSHWAYDYIMALTEWGIIDGYPIGGGMYEYRPENEITRAEIMKLIAASLDLPLEADFDGSVFSDWDAVEDWAKPYIGALVNAKIVYGSQEGNALLINAGANITRQEMIAMAVRALDIVIPMGIAPISDIADFAEADDWARDYVAYALNNNMINIYDGAQAKPLDNAKRSEAAKMLYEMLVSISS